MMRICLAALSLLALTAPVIAADPPKTAEKPAPAKPDIDLPPLPADRTVGQSAIIAGKAIRYDATVGTIPVLDDKGKLIGQVTFTAYLAPGGPSRPITFAFNGGPGASSGFLNYGAIGPKRVQFGAQGDAPSDSPVARDNPYSWLDFTDLVFIDPVGTGYSRSLLDAEGTKKAFYAAKPDIDYLARVVFDWLAKNGRMNSPKYLIGESYGGYRVPRLAYTLQSRLGVGLNGIVMVSPYLNPRATDDDGNALSPLPYMASIPSMAAAKLDAAGTLTPTALADAERYARTEFPTDFFAGRTDPQAIERLTTRISGLTGLDPAFVRQAGGRISRAAYLREIHRTQGKLGSIYDSNVTAFDPFPEAATQRTNDPILDAIMAPVTGAAVDFMVREAGWKVEGRYNLLSYEVNAAWDRDNDDAPVTDLRKAIAVDPKMGVLIVHGMDDLSCPYFLSRLVIDQMPSFGRPNRVTLGLYAGGHMFYSRPESAAKFRTDALALYRR